MYYFVVTYDFGVVTDFIIYVFDFDDFTCVVFTVFVF